MSADVAPVELVSVTIDGITTQVPKGTKAIRAAEMLGIDIPRFCDHPLLDPAGACRQCLVDVPDMGNGRGMPLPQSSCTLECMPGMVINTQQTSQKAKAAQEGILELLLINHPLDCPICDKGGECPLQNQAMSHGQGESRYDEKKRTYPTPMPVSPQILLDRERCVLCTRCTRFADQIAGDPSLSLVERGAKQQVGIYPDEPFDSYFSGNVVQICPVGALTSASYRFSSRPFDLVSTPTTCEHCASGCQLRTDHRHFQVVRRLAGDASEVNEEWSCDKGRFAFVSGRGDDRVSWPLLRENGELRVASWPEAIDAAVAGLKAAGPSVGVLTGGRLTVQNAYAYSKFARTVLGTNNVDFRTRPSSSEEASFLAAEVAGKAGVTYADLQAASRVVLVGFEPEDESPMVFLRLRKAVRKHGLKVLTVAAFLSRGSRKLNAELVPALPGDEAAALDGLELDEQTIVLVGERAAVMPGTLDAATTLARAAGAKLAWIPRRAGDRGALGVGCLPGLLPGGRLVSDPAARDEVAHGWHSRALPADVGLDANEMLARAADGRLDALVVAGAEPADFASAHDVRDALKGAAFVVSLESRFSQIAQNADVVLPVALLEEQSGSFVDWEGRVGHVGQVNTNASMPMTDLRVLSALAEAWHRPLGLDSVAQANAELAALGVWDSPRAGWAGSAESKDGEDAPADEAPAEEKDGEEASAQEAPAQDAGAQDEAESVDQAESDAQGADGQPEELAPQASVVADAQDAEQAVTAVLDDAPAEDAPAEEASADDAPAEDAPADEASPDEEPAQDDSAGHSLRLSTWRLLLDSGRGQDGEDRLAATARPAVAIVGTALAGSLGVVAGDHVTLAGPVGAVTLPVAIDAGMVDGTVWAPSNSGPLVVGELGLVHGAEVGLTRKAHA